jgi:hypothetical protein
MLECALFLQGHANGVQLVYGGTDIGLDVL